MARMMKATGGTAGCVSGQQQGRAPPWRVRLGRARVRVRVQRCSRGGPRRRQVPETIFLLFFFSFPGPLLGLCLARVALGPILQALWRVRLGDRTVWAAGVAGTGPVQRYGQVFGANGGRLKRRSEAPA